MGPYMRMLMRELAVEVHRSQGYEVSWEYVDVNLDGTALEDEEDENMFEDDDDNDEEFVYDDDEEMDTESEYEGESDEDEDGNMEI